ncbi:MAG: YebC/PmpR family DNA-binding transcriptional regulator [Planctomycetes bacterium]|nr:YebC/PmpR family DNA-binding transcriptional regulator [Planctomycetota bacterium]
MAGHSHWAGIKHRKGAADAKRGKIFSKHAKAISVAARRGQEPDSNAGLKYAIDRARADNMPKDVIERAIKKGAGEFGDLQFEEALYEGFGPDKVAVVMDILTDNRNRTASELRKIFEKRGGALGGPGSVAWMFVTRGVLEVPASAIAEEALIELVLDAGGSDVNLQGDSYEILTSVEAFSGVRKAIEERKLVPAVASVLRQPTTTVRIEEAARAEKVLNFISEVEEHDDVQSLSANFDIPEELLKKLGS